MSIMDYDYGLEDSDNHPLNQSGADIPLSDTEASVAEVLASKEPEEGVPIADEVMPGKILGLEDTIQAVANKSNKQDFKDLQNQMEDNHFGKKEGIGDAIVGVANTAKSIMKGVASLVKGKKKVSEEDLDDSVPMTEFEEDEKEINRYVSDALESLEEDVLEIQSLESIRDRLVFQKGINRSIATEAMDRLESFPYRNPNMFTTMSSKTFYEASLEAVGEGLTAKVKAYWEKVKAFFKNLGKKVADFIKKIKSKFTKRYLDDNEIKATKELYRLIEKLCNHGFNHNRFAGGTYDAIAENAGRNSTIMRFYKKLTVPDERPYVANCMQQTPFWAKFQTACNEINGGKVKTVVGNTLHNLKLGNGEQNPDLVETIKQLRALTEFPSIDIGNAVGADIESMFNGLNKAAELLDKALSENAKLIDHIAEQVDITTKLFLRGEKDTDTAKAEIAKVMELSGVLSTLTYRIAYASSDFVNWDKDYVNFIRKVVTYLSEQKEDMNKDGLAILKTIDARVIVLQRKTKDTN